MVGGQPHDGGQVYLVNVEICPDAEPEVASRCDCPARERCWHRVHVERALAGEIPCYLQGDDWTWLGMADDDDDDLSERIMAALG